MMWGGGQPPSAGEAMLSGGASGNEATSAGAQEDARPERPPFSYSELAVLALKASGGSGTVGDIYSWIKKTFPFYENGAQYWRNCIRHNLSVKKFFQLNGKEWTYLAHLDRKPPSWTAPPAAPQPQPPTASASSAPPEGIAQPQWSHPGYAPQFGHHNQPVPYLPMGHMPFGMHQHPAPMQMQSGWPGGVARPMMMAPHMVASHDSMPEWAGPLAYGSGSAPWHGPGHPPAMASGSFIPHRSDDSAAPFVSTASTVRATAARAHEPVAIADKSGPIHDVTSDKVPTGRGREDHRKAVQSRSGAGRLSSISEASADRTAGRAQEDAASAAPASSSGRNYDCTECGARFTCPSNLNRHLRVHTGEKPYSCSHCSRMFGNSSNRNKHERKCSSGRRHSSTSEWSWSGDADSESFGGRAPSRGTPTGTLHADPTLRAAVGSAEASAREPLQTQTQQPQFMEVADWQQPTYVTGWRPSTLCRSIGTQTDNPDS